MITLERFAQETARRGCDSLLAKPLATNDNTKNQVYLGPNFEVLHLIPHGALTAEGSGDATRFKAPVSLSWFDEDFSSSAAPETKLILYPQYPEVRLSGFLRGSGTAPAALMRQRSKGYDIPARIMVLGVNAVEGRIYGYVAKEGTDFYAEIRAKLEDSPQRGVFRDLSRFLPTESANSKLELLHKLAQIHEHGWIESMRLNREGSLLACKSPNCGGFTLEAALGIRPNSRSEPDYLGWEVKQHGVENFDNLNRTLRNKGKPITLMTPEPKGGAYVELGVEKFVRKYGYPDRRQRPNRWNFGGHYEHGVPYDLTAVTLFVEGFDSACGKMSGSGRIVLVKASEKEPIAIWPFAELLAHWSRKHAKAVYVPAMCLTEPTRCYCFANTVRLGEGTDYIKFLRAVTNGSVFYDPGIKVEMIAGKSVVKRRSQFRIASGELAQLYDTMHLEQVS